MVTQYSKLSLWLGIAATAVLQTHNFPDMYRAGAFPAILPNIAISLLIICSPYVFMLLKSKKIEQYKASQINFASFSILISLSGVSVLYVLIHVVPDAQNSILVFGFVILQWLAIGVFAWFEKILKRRHGAANT